MLSPEEVEKYIVEAQAGSDEAKTELIQSNLPLIKSIVRRYKNKQIEYDDLMALGTLGLIKAINNFNLEFGVRFSTYAVPMIAGEIKRFIRDDGAIKVSRSIKSGALAMNKYIEEYRQNKGGDPTIEEVAAHFKMDAGEAVFILESVHYPVSIYAENDEDGLTIADRIVAKGSPEETMDKMLLRDIIKALPEREKRIIILRYYRDKTQSEIAKELNVSQVQVSRIEAKILKKIKSQMS